MKSRTLRLRFVTACFGALCVFNPLPLPAADALPQLAQLLATTKEPQLQLDVLRGMAAALNGQRTAPMPQGWEAVEAKLSPSANAEIKALTLSLSLTFGSPRAKASLRETLTDPKAEITARRTSLDALLATKDTALAPVLQQLLTEPALRGAALRGLATYDDPGTPAKLLAAFPSFEAGEKRDALNTLASRPAYAKPLLDAVESGAVAKTEITADLLRQLRNSKDTDLRAQVGKIWGAFRESPADKKAAIEKFKRVYRAGGSQPGDASRGRAVFTRVCAQCHTLFDSGGKVGPDLTGSSRADLDYILENMVDPNAVIPNEFRASTIETKDGRSLTGIVKQQDARAVTLATANEVVTVPRAEIASLTQSELSMMPEGLLEQLAEQELRDLIYYLGRPGQVPLPGGVPPEK